MPMSKPSSARPTRTSRLKVVKLEAVKLNETKASHDKGSTPAAPAPLLEMQSPVNPEGETKALAPELGVASRKSGLRFLSSRTKPRQAEAMPGAGLEGAVASRQSKVSTARTKGGAGAPWEMAAPVLFAGTILVGGLLHPPAASVTQLVKREVSEPVRIVPTVPVSETLVVKPQAAFSFVSLQGRLRRGNVIEGHVPLSGEVSRVLVREGQHVDVGDRVLTLSTGHAEPSVAPRVEQHQSQAEQQQVEAVRRKEALEARIAQAHTDYAEAQARLDEANKKLAQSRALLKRISAGDQVLDPSAPSSPAPRSTRRPSHRADSGASSGASKADSARLEGAQAQNHAAAAEASDAQDAARAASGKARSLSSAASEAQSKETRAQSELDSAKSRLKSAQAQFDAGTVKADAVAEARSSVSQAEAGASEAGKKSRSAQEEASKAQGEADQARSKASRAQDRASQAQRGLRSAQAQSAHTPEPKSSAQPEPSQAEPETRLARRTLSASAAVRMVRESIAEATAAASNAERLKGRVESFKRSATDISSDIQSSAHNIQQAQQEVLDNTIQTSLSTLRSPASGTVLSVVSTGQGVDEGQIVVRVAQGPQGLEATLEDRSEAWKQLKPEMTLPGHLLQSPATDSQPGVGDLLGAALKALASGAAPAQTGMPVLLKVREVQPPVEQGGPAYIRVAVVPNSAPEVSPRSDMTVAIALSKGSSLLSIPAIAVARGAGSQPLVGVLHEVSVPEPQPDATPSARDDSAGRTQGSPAVDSPKAPLQVLASAQPRPAKPARERLFEIEWRPVALSDALPTASRAVTDQELEAGDSQKMKKVISGLEPGDRILRDASQWQGRFENVPGHPIRVRLALNLG